MNNESLTVSYCDIAWFGHMLHGSVLICRDHLAEFLSALKAVKEERTKECEQPLSKKPRFASYPKQLFDTLWTALNRKPSDLTKVSYMLAR